MSLPSLESIRTDYLFVSDQLHGPGSAILRQPSNVKHISFRNGCLPGEAISELLRGVKNLRALVYEFQLLWCDEDYTATIDCFDLLGSLEANQSYSRTSQIGRSRYQGQSNRPSSRIRVLREIEIQTRRCFAGNDGGPANLIGLLPVSLEGFIMRRYKTTSVGGVEALTEAILLGLVRESKAQLPHLRTLHVSTKDPGAYSAFWDCLASDKTAQINPMLSFKIQGPASEGQISAWAANVCTCGQDCFGNGST